MIQFPQVCILNLYDNQSFNVSKQQKKCLLYHTDLVSVTIRATIFVYFNEITTNKLTMALQHTKGDRILLQISPMGQ